jgi:nicotinamide mononucleotide transporter
VNPLNASFDRLKTTWSPWANAHIFVGSAVAAFGRSRALTGFRPIRIPVDLVGVPPAPKSGPCVPAAAHGVFFVMVVIGFRDRHRESRARIARSPRREAVQV